MSKRSVLALTTAEVTLGSRTQTSLPKLDSVSTKIHTSSFISKNNPNFTLTYLCGPLGRVSELTGFLKEKTIHNGVVSNAIRSRGNINITSKIFKFYEKREDLGLSPLFYLASKDNF